MIVMEGNPPLVLHGYAVSNFFNIAHAVLLEKRADFAVEITRSSQDPAFLALSPMGKIPYLVTPEGTLAETVAIAEYVEEAVAGPALLPADAFGRARVRQVVNIVQMYMEAPARSLFPGVFFGGANDPTTVASVRPMLERAMGALSRLVMIDPFLLGDRLTLADLYAFYCLDIGERLTGFVYGWSLLDSINGLRGWHGRMAERESSQTVLAAFAPVFAAYLNDKGAAYRENATVAGAGYETHDA